MTVSRYLAVHLLKKVLASKYGRHVVVVIGQVYELPWNAPPPSPSPADNLATVGIYPHILYAGRGGLFPEFNLHITIEGRLRPQD